MGNVSRVLQRHRHMAAWAVLPLTMLVGMAAGATLACNSFWWGGVGVLTVVLLCGLGAWLQGDGREDFLELLAVWSGMSFLGSFFLIGTVRVVWWLFSWIV